MYEKLITTKNSFFHYNAHVDRILKLGQVKLCFKLNNDFNNKKISASNINAGKDQNN